MELTNCNKAEIYAVDGTPLCEAHVYWDSAGMYQLLEVPCSFELSDTGEHMAIFYDSTAGLVHCRCQLRPHGNEGDVKSCSFTITEVLETIQRRQDLKVPTNAEIEISAVQMASASAAPPPKGAFTAVTENLSAGGVYFVCQYALPVDSEVHFELKEGPTPIELTAVVLRQEELPPKKRLPRFGHGCRFINLKPAAESGLRSYIFRCQRDMRQRRQR